MFNRLLELLEIEHAVTSLLIDWMDRNTQPEPEGGEDSLYASQTPPHRTGNLLLTSISELQQMPELQSGAVPAPGAVRHGAAAHRQHDQCMHG